MVDGNALVARALARAGIEIMYGVVGIPVTAVATHAMKAGIRFIAFHNEQPAGYAAGAAGYLSGKPGVFLTVSGKIYARSLPLPLCLCLCLCLDLELRETKNDFNYP
mgnify:FL=1